MGLYDTVHMRCPYCNKLNSEQTKSGDCGLNDYNLNDNIIATEGLVGDKIHCIHCKESFTIERLNEPLYATVRINKE